jgi:uncharacterized protein YcgI (DUF1989 family)
MWSPNFATHIHTILYHLYKLICVVIGTRCDDYTYKLITGEERSGSCHTYLTEAVKKVGLSEQDVHDVWNIFMCTGFTKVRSCGWHKSILSKLYLHYFKISMELKSGHS